MIQKIRKKEENEVYKAIINAGVYVDREELIKALDYDRDMYEKGYEDGYRDGLQKALATQK